MQRTSHVIAHSTTASYSARQVAAAYNCPIDQYDGAGTTIGIVELGGGYSPADLTKAGLATGQVTVVPVAGGKSVSDGPDGADGEVMLDVEVVAAVAPGAQVRVYFAPNTDAGFLAAIEQACAECRVVSISWGGPENSWDAATIDAYEQVLSAARARGVHVYVASGDTGSQDSGGRGNHVDFPASSPSVIGCGGTKLLLNPDGTRKSEVTWDENDKTSATGGGVSAHFPGRQVPDVAGNADPVTGYHVIVDGSSYVIGGTSAVAPLYAAMDAVLFQAADGQPFDFLNAVLTNPAVCYDVTVGDNGGYKAGPGRDQVTGYGVVDMGRLLAVLTSGVQVPTPDGGTPPPPVPLDLAKTLRDAQQVVADLQAAIAA